ncbi:MAG: penicillin acylase family protein [Chloroflexi bacterium]|nr:penicillin acylase family protein [Chloroflexota bacterium]
MPFFLGALLGGIVLGGAAFALLRVFMRRSLPQVNGNIKLAGLAAPVEIIRDRWGVPHIYAQSLADAVYAQGFAHAQDRLWQLELNRRIGHGRLAELFGEIAYGTDHFIRTVGFSRAAQNDLAQLDDESRRLLDAYTRGVNAGMAQARAKLPLEFTLLRHTPEPWTPLDSVVYTKVMAWALSCNWDMEILNAAMIGKLGPQRAARLVGDYHADNPIIVPEQTYAALARDVIAHFEEAHHHLPLGGLDGMSNNWVVDGAKSATGKPLLANDPHLALQMPSIWYEVHLSTPETEVTGVSFPGTPFVVIGHNREIAWGFTNGFPDVQDIYIEKFNPANPAEYEFKGQWEPATIIKEEIRVKGEAAPRVVEIVQTRHGPIINHLTPLTAGRDNFALAFRWTAHEPANILRAIAGMNRATDWPGFCEAIRDWSVPAQNMVYADRAGNIGYYMPGKVPIRARGIGASPVPGWTGEYEWTGWIPHEEMPHAFNPAQHYIATANNQVVGQEYPHFLTTAYMNGFRARRIVDQLTAQDKLSADDFARIQVDLYCEPARVFCGLLRGLELADADQRAALERLAGWDYFATKDSVPAALFELAQHFAMKRVFGPWLCELTDYYLGVGFHPLLATFSPYHDRSLVTLQRILVDNEIDWFEDAAEQPLSREQILSAAIADAVAYLKKAVGPDMSRWTWGRIHQAAFNHTLGAQKPLDRIFNRGPYPYGGDTNTVWQAAFVPQLPIAPGGGSASWRQIIDVSDWDASRAVHTTGQSGHPASKHYDDMIPMWLNGDYHPMLWARERVEAHAESRLTLTP